jgi:hypothetical protein
MSGLDDATGIVWAFGMFFLMMVTCFLLLTKYFLVLLGPYHHDYDVRQCWRLSGEQRATATTSDDDDEGL